MNLKFPEIQTATSEALPSFKSEWQYGSDETNSLTFKQTHHPKHEQIQNEHKTSKHQSVSVFPTSYTPRQKLI